MSSTEMVLLNQLHRRRHDLKQQLRFEEAIAVQREILEVVEETGAIRELSNAWNMLSHLYHLNRQVIEAEEAARKALSTYATDAHPRLKTLATYEMKLAIILADQRRFAEAVQYGEVALEHFSDFHSPPDDFLIGRQTEVARMVSLRDAGTEYMEEPFGE